jgi:acyl phosphate:glycerol-3-phosphate acyltransferase
MWALLSIPLGYLLGSFPSTYLIGKAVKKVDLCAEGDGHVSATAVYRNVGRIPFVITVALDVAKGAVAVLISSLLTADVPVILAAGAMAMVGHCWSVFIRFRGGLGGTVIIGVLFGLAWWQLLISISVMAIIFFITRKSTLATVLLTVFMAIALYFTRNDWLTTAFPFILLAIQFVKRATLKGKRGKADYKNDLFSDMKRVK